MTTPKDLKRERRKREWKAFFNCLKSYIKPFLAPGQEGIFAIEDKEGTKWWTKIERIK